MARIMDETAACRRARLALSPLLLALATVAWAASDRLLHVGPLDRAAFGWLVVVPLLLLTPGAAALAGRRASLIVAAGLGTAAVAALSVSMTTIGCAPVTWIGEAIPVAMPVGIALAVGFAGASLAAGRAHHRARRTAAGHGALGQLAGTFVVGAAAGAAAGVIVLLVYAASFPALSCAWPG